jgi:hypothetical protein
MVMEVATDFPLTPNAENVFKSAWSPAPPLGSNPATVKAVLVAVFMKLKW